MKIIVHLDKLDEDVYVDLLEFKHFKLWPKMMPQTVPLGPKFPGYFTSTQMIITIPV